jgi:hypothetical protein
MGIRIAPKIFMVKYNIGWTALPAEHAGKSAR